MSIVHIHSNVCAKNSGKQPPLEIVYKNSLWTKVTDKWRALTKKNLEPKKPKKTLEGGSHVFADWQCIIEKITLLKVIYSFNAIFIIFLNFYQNFNSIIRNRKKTIMKSTWNHKTYILHIQSDLELKETLGSTLCQITL